MKYLIQCKFCGTLLFKTENPMVNLLISEIKCSNFNCKKLLKMPGDTIVNPEKGRKSGLKEKILDNSS